MDKDKLKKLRGIVKTIKKANKALIFGILLAEEVVEELRDINVWNNREGEEFIKLSSLLTSHYKDIGFAKPVWDEAHLQDFDDLLDSIEKIIKNLNS